MARTSRALRSPEAPRPEEGFEDAVLEAGGEASLEGARIADPDLAGARVHGLRLLDSVIERGNLANLSAAELTLRRVEVTGTRLTGAQWTRGSIADVTFRDCRIDLATFAGTTFERVAFDGCLLMQADLREALLRDVRLDGCDLTEADLTGLRLDRVELRGCALDGVTGLERLRGAAMPWTDVVGNAGAFAASLGIRLLDEDERR